MEVVGRVTDEATLIKRNKGGYFVYFCVVINKRIKVENRIVKLQEYINCRYWKDTEIATTLFKNRIVILTGDISEVPYIDPCGEIQIVQNLHVVTIRLT